MSVALLALPRVAAAASKAECVAAYEEGQKLRAKSQLRDAREQFLVCADPSCPNATRGQCTEWVTEVDQSMPTLSFAVTAEGKDVTDVTIYVDDALLTSALDGKALPVDPGKHRLRVERGADTTTIEVVVREGEKNRSIPVTLGKKASSTKPGEEGGALSPGVWVLGGVGVAALGLFGVMGGIGLSEKSDAEATCAPTCTDAEVSPIRTKFIVADVSLGVGVAAIGGAVIWGAINLTSPGSADDTPADATAALPLTVVAGPLEGGGYVGVAGRF